MFVYLKLPFITNVLLSVMLITFYLTKLVYTLLDGSVISYTYVF